MMNKLVISLDGMVVREVPIANERTALGRRPYNEIVIDNLAVSGETLDRAGLVGWIFKPLSWAFFNAELTGTSKDNKWRLSTVLSKVLPGSSGGNSGDALEPLPEP